MKKLDKDTYDLWIAEALNDFEMGDILFNSKKYNGSIFYFIQSAEKAVKALLFLLNQQPWGHSILNLLNECEKKGIKITPNLKKFAKDLEQHYISSRYPDATPGKAPKDAYDEKKAKSIRGIVQEYLEFVKKEVGGQIP